MAYWQQPDIDPVLIRLWGPFQIRWYSLLYVGAFVVARFMMGRLSREKRFKFTDEDIQQVIVWFLVGAVIGARIIYCFVYDPRSLLANPLYLFQVYRGGLSFHGGLLGVMAAGWLYCRQHKIPWWNLADAVAFTAPVGLGMGRIGNFINGELFGRPTDVPWAIIFREGGPVPRHPSQLYEFLLEGVLLFLVVAWVKRRSVRDGTMFMAYLMGYAVCRFVGEFFREPDPQVGYLALHFSMGQWLSILMLCVSGLAGYWFIWLKPIPIETKKGRRG